MKLWFENIVLGCLGFMFLGVNVLDADELFKPSSSCDLSQVPPFVSNLSKIERENLEEQKQKDFKQILQTVVHGNDEDVENVADELSKNPSKLNQFINSLPVSVIKNNRGVIEKDDNSLDDYYSSKELRLLLDRQYIYPELKNKKVSLKLKRTEIYDAISLIAKAAGLSFIIDPNITGITCPIDLTDVSVACALRILLASNRPRLALIKDGEVYRIIRLNEAKKILISDIEELKEKEFEQAVVILTHVRWNETQKMQIEKMWQGIVGEFFGKDGYYIVFDESNNKIFFRGKKHQVDQFKKYLTEIDIKVPQVKIEARFVCADKGFEENVGFQWSGIYNRRASVKRGFNFIGGGKPLSDINNSPTAQSQDSLIDWVLNLLPTPDSAAKNIRIPFIFGGSDLNTKRLNLVLNAAENRNEIKTILKPTVLTNNKEEAEILVGENVPIETIVEESVEGRLRNVRTANYKDIGIQLKVRPVVTSDCKEIFLDIFVENSLQSSSVTTDKTTYPIITTTRTRNKVLLQSGETTMISGLIKNITSKYKTQTPLLSEIPVLGWLFKGSRKKIEDVQLLIFITPSVV